MDFYRVHLLCAASKDIPLKAVPNPDKAREYLTHGKYIAAMKQADYIASQIKLGNYYGKTADSVASIEVRQHCPSFGSVTCLYTVDVYHPGKKG